MLLASAGCGYGFGASAGPGKTLEAERPVQLNVTNHSGGPVEVYATGSGTAYRIGTVHPGLAGRFVVRPGMVVNRTVALVARSASGAVVRSGPMLLVPGDVVDFELAGNAVTSTATVRSWVENGP
jgi:hypothetical protein